MKVGFDYWQVLSHFPVEFEYMADAMASFYPPAEVHIITAVGKDREHTVEAEISKVWSMPVHVVVFDHPGQSPELKLAKCQELGLDIFFDDRDDVCRLLNKHGILALRVTRKDNSTYDLGAELGASK